ncbi:FMN-binding negative transcriptional regulator [Kitasatospora sp. NPDC088264]|uniref:FMN-binding negative transcriptional regulator n=1 Tax=Kitasatospora sp. NPDC088264 TaxID=3155296 RepID=UPI0034158493
MFVPGQYRPPDGTWMTDLVRANPLALLVTNGAADGPLATHLPVIPEPAPDASDRPTDLSGAVLLGHMNKANPQWKALADETAAVLTFTGPHAYVSPTTYAYTPAAPTWNFTAVHLRGRLSKLAPGEETLQVVCSTVEAFEEDHGTGWDMSGSLDYFRRILPAVGAFRFTVTKAEGMFKLSQEQKPEVRERVRAVFGECPSTRHRETAALMGRLPS